MKFKATFHKTEQSFRSDFGEVHNISDGGYERGYAAGEEAGIEQGKEIGFADGYAKGYDAGNSLYYATQVNSTYSGAVFPPNHEMTIKLAGDGLWNLYQTFVTAKNIKSVKFIIDNKDCLIPLEQTFRESDIVTVDFTETSCKFTGNISYAFFQCNSLTSIIGALDLSECTNLTYSFHSTSLRDVEFEPKSIRLSVRFNSAYLTEKSRQSIIDGLADLTDSEPQTITLNGVGAILTEEQKAQIAAKNWTLAY